MPRMIIDSKTGIVKRKPTTGGQALANSGESVWGEGLVVQIGAHGLSPGNLGQKLVWYNRTLKRKPRITVAPKKV